MRSGIVVFSLFGLLFAASVSYLGVTSVHADSATDCSQLGAGYRPATASDAAVKNGQIPVGTCYNPDAAGISQQAEQAKQWLAQHAQAKSTCGTASDQSFEKLQSNFAVCAYNALKKYEDAGNKFTISSAYRSQQQQVCVCGPTGPQAGVCGSAGPMGSDGYAISCNGHWHQCGLALDINPGNGNYDQLHQYIQGLNAGVGFPIASTDKPHMQSTNPSQCGAGSTSGGVASGSVLRNIQQGLLGSQGLANLFTPPQPMQCPQGFLLMNGTCVPQQAMASTQTNPYSYLSPSPAPQTSPTSNVYGTDSSGTINPSSAGTNTNTNTNGNTNGITIGSNVAGGGSGTSISGIIDSGSGQKPTGSTVSAIDLINAIANPTTTALTASSTAATGTPVALGSSLNNTVALHGTNVSIDGSWQASSTYALSPTVSQTFVSQDLSQTPTSMQTAPLPTNSTFTILEDLKQKLLYVISYLRPFGSNIPHPTAVNNTATAYLE